MRNKIEYKTEYLLFKMDLGDRWKASELGSKQNTFSYSRIFCKFLSQRLAKLGAVACLLCKTTAGKISVEHMQRNRSGESWGSQNSSLEGMLVYVWDLGWTTGECRVEVRREPFIFTWSGKTPM